MLHYPTFPERVFCSTIQGKWLVGLWSLGEDGRLLLRVGDAAKTEVESRTNWYWTKSQMKLSWIRYRNVRRKILEGLQLFFSFKKVQHLAGSWDMSFVIAYHVLQTKPKTGYKHLYQVPTVFCRLPIWLREIDFTVVPFILKPLIYRGRPLRGDTPDSYLPIQERSHRRKRTSAERIK